MESWKKLVLIAPFVTCMACNDGDPTGRVRVESLPSQFRLTAGASKTETDGTTLTCSLDFMFELKSESTRTDHQVSYKGTQGGHAIRRLFSKDGSGFVFTADTFGEIEADLNIDTGETVIRIPVNETSPNRFWKQMSRFDAVVDSNGNGSGVWICAPLDIDQGGYTDNSISASGSFQITPLPVS